MHVNLEAIHRGYALHHGIPFQQPEVDAAQIRALLTTSARLRAICKVKGWDMGLILTRSHRWPIVRARNAAIRQWVEIFPDHSLKQVGRVFGLTHHTSVLHALGRTTRARARHAKNHH